MSPEEREFMNLQAPPARLTQQQAAWYLGFQFHDVPTLVAAGLLRPLGRPVPNGLKFFATVELEKLRADLKWLARASDAIKLHWRKKNHSKLTLSARHGHRGNDQPRSRESQAGPLVASLLGDA